MIYLYSSIQKEHLNKIEKNSREIIEFHTIETFTVKHKFYKFRITP